MNPLLVVEGCVVVEDEPKLKPPVDDEGADDEEPPVLPKLKPPVAVEGADDVDPNENPPVDDGAEVDGPPKEKPDIFLPRFFF